MWNRNISGEKKNSFFNRILELNSVWRGIFLFFLDCGVFVRVLYVNCCYDSFVFFIAVLRFYFCSVGVWESIFCRSFLFGYFSGVEILRVGIDVGIKYGLSERSLEVKSLGLFFFSEGKDELIGESRR